MQEGALAAEPGSLAGIEDDPRWHLVERIAESEGFRKSSRLPALIRYLARCTLTGDRKGLSEQSIGKAVFHKRESYTPAEDSSVRVYIRQLRLRLHEFFEGEGKNEALVVDIPRGSYALSFDARPAARADAEDLPPALATRIPLRRTELPRLTLFLLLAAVLSAAGWVYSAWHAARAAVPWPLDQVITRQSQTTVVLADAGYSLRLLGDKPIPLESYIDRSYTRTLLPEHMEKGEARLLHYLAVSQLTSMADVNATAMLSSIAAPLPSQLVFRSARDINPTDLSRGNFIFIGARTSNPWVELFDEDLNFRIVEDLAAGTRSIVNEHPAPGERSLYSVPNSTGTSGEDYATLALLPNKANNRKVLLVQGLRLEGTEAAINLLRSEALRAGLEKALTSANHGKLPAYFEVLLHAKSVAGSPLEVEYVAMRFLQG